MGTGSFDSMFRVLGPLELPGGGAQAAAGPPKQRVLLATLLLSAGELVTRDRAVDAVWGEDPPERADTALQVYVHHLRRTLGRERIETRGAGYLLHADTDEVDALRFEKLVAEARATLVAGAPERSARVLHEALALWRGDALSDLPDVPFVVSRREWLNERRLEAAELFHEARLALGADSELVAELEAFVREHPFRERGWAQLMLALYRSGRQADAIDAFRRMRSAFSEELGLEPGPEVRELERAILRQDASLLPAVRSSDAGQMRLPRPATPLVGRRLEVAAVAALLREEGNRLVTLTGPGGVGKTRLAIAAATEVAETSADGAVFVDLTSIAEPSLLLSSIASAAGLAGVSPDDLASELGSSELLIVLDNFEQLLEAAPVVGALVTAAPRLRLLVTSRAPLRILAERVYRVLPFETPAGDDEFETIVQSDAVRIFTARAAAVDPAFQLSDATAPVVAEICRMLEGLPLAIELAAARTRLLAPEQMLERLARPLEVLGAGDRDAPARHQTLRATIDWSYELLAERERLLFSQLAVFAGGCTLDAIEQVCGGDLDALATLLDNSLVLRSQEPGREPRFRMLVTVRSYADSRLADPLRAETRERHAAYFLELAERLRHRQGRREAEAEAFERLDLEHDNLRAALAWAEEAGEVETLLRLVIALRLFWTVRGHLEEGTAWFETAVSAPGAAASRHHPQALSGGGTLAFRRGDYELARRWWEWAQTAFEQAGDTAATARTLGDLAGIALAAGDLDRAMELWTESADQLRALGDEMRLAIALANIGVAASAQQDHARAVHSLQEALELSRRVQDPSTEGAILFNLGRNLVELGGLDEGEATMRDALALAEELGYRELVAHCLLGLADIAVKRDDLGEAERLLAGSDELVAALGLQFQQEEVSLRERTAAALVAASAHAQQRVQ